jgi:hypothetical protein
LLWNYSGVPQQKNKVAARNLTKYERLSPFSCPIHLATSNGLVALRRVTVRGDPAMAAECLRSRTTPREIAGPDNPFGDRELTKQKKGA